MIEDIVVHLEEGEEDKCETSQQCVGMKDLYQGMKVKDWKGADFHCMKYQKLNKIVVHYTVQYYRKYQLHRNKCYCNENLQRKRVIEWKENFEKDEKSTVEEEAGPVPNTADE